MSHGPLTWTLFIVWKPAHSPLFGAHYDFPSFPTVQDHFLLLLARNSLLLALGLFLVALVSCIFRLLVLAWFLVFVTGFRRMFLFSAVCC